MSAPQQASAFNNQIPPRYTIKNITAAYTVTGADYGVILNCTGATSYALNLAPAASVGAGFNVWIWNQTTTTAMAVTITPASETIDGVATLVLNRGEGTQIVCDGTNWQTGNKKTMRGYAENYAATTTRPLAIASQAIALGNSYAAGTDSFAAAISTNSSVYGAQGSNSIAIGYQATSVGAQAVSIGASAAANFNYSLALGGSAGNGPTAGAQYAIAIGAKTTAGPAYSSAIGMNSGTTGSVTATGQGSMALGGSYASGTDSFAAAIANNTSTYGAVAGNSIAIGYLTKASGGQSFAIGYSASATTAAVAIGNYANASGVGAVAISTETSGYFTTASASSAVAVGNRALSNIVSKYAYAGGAFNNNGDAQYGLFILRRATTDATATVLTSDASAASTNNQVILPNNSAFTFNILVVARQSATGGTASASWQITGLIRREGTAASTTLVASTVTTISNVPAWTIAVTADTTNGCLAVTATGAAATNIRWVATVQTSEVTYA